MKLGFLLGHKGRVIAVHGGLHLLILGPEHGHLPSFGFLQGRDAGSAFALLPLHDGGKPGLIVHRLGEVVSVDAGPPEQDPNAKGGAGVPPDLVATLVFGRYGAGGLAARHDDVRLGRASELMEVLFPKLESDILTSL